MMIRRALAFTLIAAPASAGCANFADGSMSSAPPAYEICNGTSCDSVLLERECANVHGHLTQWGGGWARRCRPNEPCEWTWRDRAIRADRARKITVRQLAD